MTPGRVGHFKLRNLLQALFEIAPCLMVNELCTTHVVCHVMSCHFMSLHHHYATLGIAQDSDDSIDIVMAGV